MKGKGKGKGKGRKRPLKGDSCRHWLSPSEGRCGQPAVLIVWGQYATPDEIGPKCMDHVPEWIARDMHRLDQYSVFDLRPINERLGR